MDQARDVHLKQVCWKPGFLSYQLAGFYQASGDPGERGVCLAGHKTWLDGGPSRLGFQGPQTHRKQQNQCDYTRLLTLTELELSIFHKDTWVTFLRLQLVAGKILHDASAEGVAQHIDSGPQMVPAENNDAQWS